MNEYQDLDEASLLRRYASGDARAARQLTELVLPSVLRYARRMLGDAVEAEDVAQEAMMRLWRVAPDWRSGEAKVTTWLYRVTANLCVDRLRRKKASSLQDADKIADMGQSPLDSILEKSRMDALQSALLDLPERQRQAVILRHIEGLSNPEISDVMDISIRAVESLTARGKQALAQQLTRQRSEIGFENEG